MNVCDLCIYNPPSSCDGKPCIMCPATTNMAIEQEPSGDLISRQEVLELVADYDLSMGQVVKGIHALPSVKQELKWIPISEGLPEKDDRYLAYIVNEYDTKLQYIMTCDYMVDGHWHWSPDDECASDNVIAWMPLPQPYEPKESK